MTDPTSLPEETLDPTTPEEWEALRALGHQMVDQVVAFHRQVGEGPAWQPVPADVRGRFQGPLPSGGAPVDETVDRFWADVFPYHLGNVHPRGWGWVNGTGSTLGALADLMASSMNVNCAGADTAARYVEEQVLDTLKHAMGWPASGSGILTSGASLANLIGLAAARDRAVHRLTGLDAGAAGLLEAGARLTFYTSASAHNSVDRAIRLLGLGTDQLRRVPVDDAWRMDLQALRDAIAQDREAGAVPAAIVGTAGTVDQGAIDPLDALADLAAEQGMWLHVDGAFGAVAALSPALRPLVSGMERADSLAFDLHKWMHVPIEAGCVLVRDPAHHKRPFAAPAAYLAPLARGLAAVDDWFFEFGPQLTRGFRALKSWFFLMHHGTDKLGRLVEQNVRQTQRLAALMDAHPRLEILARGPLCVLCFRYRAPDMDPATLDRFNQELLGDLQESGRAQVTATRVGGSFTLRLALTNHRTRDGDLTGFLEDLVALGDRRKAGGALA